MFQSPELTAAVVLNLRPFHQGVIGRDEDFGNFKWRRMMSSTAEPAAKPPSLKQGDAGTEKKEGGDEVMPASYWGISRSKITRDDGSEWPWNCFMVTNKFAVAYFDIIFKLVVLILRTHIRDLRSRHAIESQICIYNRIFAHWRCILDWTFPFRL